MSKIQTIRNNIEAHYRQEREEYNKEKDRRRNNKYNKYYGSRYWQQLRSTYYLMHPCCECCERQNIVTPTDEIHHKHKFSSGITEEAKWNLLLNEKNLVALCQKHHRLAHLYMERYNTDTAGIDEIIQLEEQLNNKY